MFLAMSRMVLRGRRSAMWCALCLSVVIVSFSVPSLMSEPRNVSASFLPLFGTCVAVTNWVALRRETARIAQVEAKWRAKPGISQLLPSYAAAIQPPNDPERRGADTRSTTAPPESEGRKRTSTAGSPLFAATTRQN